MPVLNNIPNSTSNAISGLNNMVAAPARRGFPYGMHFLLQDVHLNSGMPTRRYRFAYAIQWVGVNRSGYRAICSSQQAMASATSTFTQRLCTATPVVPWTSRNWLSSCGARPVDCCFLLLRPASKVTRVWLMGHH